MARCRAALVLLFALLSGPLLSAQTRQDSLAWERRLGTEGDPADSVAASARRTLLGFLRSEDEGDATALIDFMEHRADVNHLGPAPWLEPRERLMVEIARAHADTVATPALLPLLEAAVLQPYIRRSLRDRFTLDLADYLLHYTPRMQRRLKEDGAEDAGRAFHLLLVNRFSTTGVRARADVNREIERFIAANPSSPLAPIAERWLITPYQESDLGGAVAVGWEQGGWSGPIAERLDGASGPSIELEGYIEHITVVAGLAGATVEVPATFPFRSDSIASGRAGVQWARAMIGYELRFNRTAFTPLIGVAEVGWSRNDDGGGAGLPGGTTWTGGLQIGYRILPADVGPHIDLRVRASATGAGLAGEDASLSGTRWSVQVGIALVARPMVVIP